MISLAELLLWLLYRLNEKPYQTYTHEKQLGELNQEKKQRRQSYFHIEAEITKM
jgi:hypothetical protein